MKSKMTAMGLWIMALITLIGVDGAYALKSPHNADRSVSCLDCHVSGWQTRFKSRRPPCLDCHNPLYNGVDTAKKRYLTYESASNVFGTFTNVNNKVQTSHVWSVPEINSNAGATGMRTVKRNTRYTSGINCTNCHYAHGSSDQAMFPQAFLRQDKRGDGICLTCHYARQVGAGSARTYPPASGKYYSHPVEVNYSSIRAAKGSSWYWDTPQTSAGYSQSAVLKLYTAFNFDSYGNAASVKAQNAVICSTCHGPLHSADSNPYTFDSLTGYSMGHYSTGDGYLLRRYNSKKSNDICTSCHTVKTHQGNGCGTCHEPHKKPGDTNIYLIKRVIATPYGNHSVFFTSTTQMAERYGIYSMPYSSRSNAICQVCHRTKTHHRAYSTTGADRVHNVTRNCTACHPHNATADGFRLEGGCAGCHGQPPDDTFGRHGKHTNDSAQHSWKDGKNVDARSAGSYGLACGRCHNPWTPYTATVENYKGPRHFTDYGSYKTYTADIGFANGTPLPANDTTKAGYNFGARGAVDNGPSTTDNFGFNTPLSGAGTCRNIYCHGQFYNGYTSNDPIWNANNNQPCGKCHGVAPELGKGIPGNTGGSNWGAHPRHAGNAAQQYGAGGNFRCNACHAISATQNAISSVGLDRRYHVNGRINLRFYTSFGYSASKYGTYNNYSAAIPTNITKPAYKTCQLVYCHSDGSRMSNFSAQSHTNSMPYPNWSSIKNFTTTVGGIKARCVRCHGNPTFKGITAAMPGVTSKANSHEKHIRNGFLCYDCHSQTVASDSRTIASTSKHVNKTWDVNIVTKYGGSYNSGTKTCDNVKCHGQRTTPAWGTTGRCQDCHYKSTAETTTDEGYADNYAWKSMTSTASVPRIYSAEWSGKGHGASGGKLPKVCTDCHKASGTASHSSAMTNNPFRLYTAASHLDDLCQACHGTGGARSAEADKKVISHTVAAVGGDATWAFTPKCIDCHDPHGDKNRAMIQKYINYSGSDPTTGKRTYDISNSSGYMTFSTVGGGLINWSSYVKNDFTGICQRCHNTQSNMKHFRKYSTSTGDGYNANHNPGNRCTNCHTHDTGFKPKDCGGCHYFPPTLSGKHSFHVATTVTKVYVGYEVNNTKTKYAYGCGKCHDSGDHYAGAGGNYTTEVAFDTDNSYPRNSGTYVFGAKSSFDEGADGVGGFKWTSTKGTCQNLYCHGEFAGGNTTNDPYWYNNGPSDPQVCGKCHGASQASAPTGGAHGKHVGTLGYDCRNCHDDTVDAGVTNPNLKDKKVHVDGKTQYKLYTAWSARIGGAARYYNVIFGRATTEVSSPTYGFCTNNYCHSKGSDTTNPYNDAAALPNYTAKWGGENLPANPGEKCSYCHGSKTYKGITAAMPNQASQAHKIHVVDSNITRCYICHANVVNSSNQISNTANHVNQFKNISIIMTYRSGGAVNYGAPKTCANIKCHGGRTTPAWTATATCKDCHYSTSDTADYQFRNYSVDASIARIYSSQWTDKGHGRTSGYPYSGNAGASKTCTNCHSTSVKHNTASNPFRLFTSDPDKLCAACHGSGTGELGKWSQTFGVRTGIKTHSQANVNDGANQGNAAWDFGQHFDADQKRAKCVDCHDPHGDTNRYMVSSQVNYTGTNKYGVPAQVPSGQMLFSTIGGQFRWSSYVKSDYSQICQRCHSGGDANMANFSKNDYNTGHNAGTRCVTCHTHKQGFKGGGCYGCHGTQASNGAPPDSPSAWTSDKASNWTTVGLHEPHGYNPRNRYINGSAGGTYSCAKCHGPETDGRSETAHPGNTDYAGMRNLTSTATPSNEKSNFSTGGTTGKSKVVDDTCWNTGCHTPRAYTRKWGKPRDCDDCHGTIRLRGATERAYKLHTTMSHKIHINYTGVASPPAAWGKNYRFACTNCHYNVGNNYSTHYSGQVNITSNGPVNTVGGQFYSRGRSFKGFTTGNEVTNTTYCTNTYCHGKFTNGTTTTRPSWKKGASTLHCGSCHKAKTAKIAAWTNGTTMPARHPKHVRTSTYSFACSKCHVRTVTNNTTVFFQYSAHVNGTVNVAFDSVSGSFNSSTKSCLTSYCHSRGNTQAAPYSMANYTAEWDQTAVAKTGAGKECSFCHGNKSYGGITAAMPAQASQAHLKHAHNTSGDNFKCYVCHANVVNANGAIVSYTNHVNKFKNISIILTYKSGATNYNPAGTKKCDNVKCHGGRTTPAWTASANCQDCHYGSTAEDNWTWQNYTGGVAQIYSSEWTRKGHASYRTCTNCHTSSVKHGTATNPFRLFTSDPDMLCAACHGSGTGEVGKWGAVYGNKTGIKTHSQSATNGDATWPSNFQNAKAKCVDCHDPHGDRNRAMIQSYINMTGSDQYGKPTATASMIYTTAGSSNLLGWSSFVKSGYTGICQRCHNTQTNMNHFNKAAKSGGGYDTTHNIGKKCTDCHKHTEGFKGAGASTGGQPCEGCHNLKDAMRSPSGYHHVMMNVSAVYRNVTLFGSGDLTNKARRCLMCHVDHDKFNSSKAKNLRQYGSDSGAAGINTDFWPAKRKNAVRTGGDAGTGNYSSTYPIKGTAGFGVCISCHKNTQYKNTTLQYDQTRRARDFSVAIYTSSSHNYQVISGLNNFSDGTSFRANCAKCHNSRVIDQSGAQAGRKFGTHDSQSRSILNYSTEASKPKTQEMCYKCHSNDYYSGSKYEYYSSVKMMSSAKLIKAASTAKTYKHPIGANAGGHSMDEYFDATEGWNRGAKRHIECTDCHNTHGGNASVERKVGSKDGNKVAGAQSGTWGVSLTYPGFTPPNPGTQYSNRGSVPTFTKVEQVTYQHEVCLKCHSRFGYYTTPPAIPSGGIDTTLTTAGVAYDTVVAGIAETDQSREFNPNNPGYHPVIAKGRNQPAHTANSVWPGGGVVEYVNPYTNRTSFKGVSGLGWTFVPPWDQKSLMGCTDCHQADNTGKAMSMIGGATTVGGNGNWDNDAVGATLWDADGVGTTSTGTTTAQKVDISGPSFSGNATKIQVAVYVKHSLGKNKNITVTVIKDGTTTVSTNAIPTSTTSDYVRYAADVTTAMTTNTCLTYSCLQNQIELTFVASGGSPMSVDAVALEAEYPFTEKLRGPHGSMGRWLLETVNNEIHFKVGGSYIYPNSDVASGSTEATVFCYNCHRRDVYTKEGGAGGTYATYSRLTHPGGATQHAAVENPWGIWCMNCHGGKGSTAPRPGRADAQPLYGYQGGIHGIFQSSTAIGKPWFTTNGFQVWPRPVGVRLLVGATMMAKAESGTVYCYTNAATDATGSCASEAAASDTDTNGGQSTTLNYMYTGW